MTSQQYVEQFCTGCHWDAFKRSTDNREPDPFHAILPVQTENTYERRVRLLALNILALAKNAENAEGWSRTRLCKFWCLIAGISWQEYREAVASRGERSFVSRHMRKAA